MPRSGGLLTSWSENDLLAVRLILGIAALAILVIAVLRDRFPQSKPQSAAAPSTLVGADSANATTAGGIVYIARRTGSILVVPPEQMRDVVRAHRRLRPDRRVLLAVADLHNILTGTPRRPVFARWTGAGWAVEYGDPRFAVGTLPELASLADARRMLAAWATAVGRTRPAASATTAEPALASDVRRAIDSVSAPIAFEALARVDQEWQRSHDPRLLSVAAEGLTTLAMFVDDRTDMADAVFARALAASVAARVLSPNPPRRAEAILAYELGYGSEAHDSANALAADDPVRVFLDRDDSVLVKLADRDRPDPLARYLAMRRAAETGKAAWDSALTRSARWSGVSTAGLETGFASDAFDFARDIPGPFARATFLELDRVAPSSSLTDRVLGSARRQFFASLDPGLGGSLGSPQEIAALERRLGDARNRFSGPFADSALVAGYYRSTYFAAVAGAARFALQALSSVPASEALAARMKGDQPGGAGAEYAGWLAHLARAKAGRDAKPELTTDIANARWLGQQQLGLAFEEVARGALFNEHPDVADVARSYASRLDSRPAHLWAAADVSYRHIWDMPNAERLYRRAAELDRDNRQTPWVARLTRDTLQLRRIVEDATAPHARRIEAARLLGVDSLARGAYVRGWFEKLIAARPGDWSTRDAYIEVLDAHEDAVTIERVAKEWLEQWEVNARNSFEPVNARVALSRALVQEKRYADAWEVVRPAIPSYVNAAMMQGSRALGKLGRLDSAYALAVESADRYPDVASPHVMVAEVLWRQRKYAESAKYLQQHSKWFDSWTWRGRITDSFLDVFGDKPEHEATEAIQQLASAGIPGWVLGQFGIGLRHRKRPDLAFAMQARSSEPTGAGGQVLPMQAYASLREWRGDSVAVSWLRQLTRGLEGPTAMILYQDNAFEELWSLERPGRQYSTFTWLMRAAAAANKASLGRRHRAELLAYYQRPIRDDYHAMGRYLVGLTSESDLLALATTPERRCEIAYYLGVRARAEGRPYDAADWFEVSLETRQMREGELIWSAQQLSAWANQGKTLAVLEAGRR